MPDKKEPLKNLRAHLISRGLSLAKASLQASGVAAREWLNPAAEGSGQPAWSGQMRALVEELGQLKGTAMKVGQTLSMYGEHLLPKEMTEMLKTLQQEAPPMAWSTIEQVLLREWGPDRLGRIEIDPVPVGAASIGQVHRAVLKDSGEVLALKVQYPGVDAAVETDLKLLKFMFNMSGFVPRGPRLDQIFAEIRDMFHQEIDYGIERAHTEWFSARLRDDDRYLVPRIFPEFCTRRVLAASYIEGARIDSSAVQTLPQERRDRLGRLYLDLYLRELLEFRKVQTDPHMGNYRVGIDPGGTDRLILFDFGAVRGVPDDFLRSYRQLMRGGLDRDARLIERGGRGLGLLQPQDPVELVADYVDLCCLLTEPFALPEWGTVPGPLMDVAGAYDWRGSDLPKRVAAQALKVAKSYRLRAPPKELVFLDRKLSGVFIMLSVLGCRLRGREMVEQRLTATA